MIGYSRKPMDQMFRQRSIIQDFSVLLEKFRGGLDGDGDMAEIGGHISNGQTDISSAMKPTVHRRISGTRNFASHVVAESKYQNRNITRVLSHPGLEQVSAGQV
jgi:hypothetical protein